MNLETQGPKNRPISQEDLSLDDFEFKPLTSGLGFNHPQKTTEVKPSFGEQKNIPATSKMPIRTPVINKNESQIYRNDLSLFYGQSPVATPVKIEEIKEDRPEFRIAGKVERIIAYSLDFGFIVSTLGLVLTVMSRVIEMDLIETWSEYPNEITPLVLTLFSGFYFIYFSIFEKTSQSTFGKELMGLRVLNLDNRSLSFSKLFLRSFVTLANFVSLGLFSYFDLQNKITDSKVVKKL